MLSKVEASIGVVVTVVSGATLLYILACYVAPIASSSTVTRSDAAILLVHVTIPICAAVFIPVFFRGRSSGRSLTISSVTLVVFIIFIAVAAISVRSLANLGPTSDYAPSAQSLAHARGADVWLLSGRGFLAMRYLGLAMIAGSALAGYLMRGPSATMTSVKRGGVSIVVLVAIATLWFATEGVIAKIDWWYYGTIHAFCWMAFCLLALPLMVIAFGLILATRDEATTTALILFCVASICAILVANLAAGELVRSGSLRAPHSAYSRVALHGICRVLANSYGMRIDMVAITGVTAVILFLACRSKPGQRPNGF